MNNTYSIIVPVYNGELFIEECIESLIRQSYQKIEIIIVDDGSRDRTPQICDLYGNMDSRIKVIHQLNSGVVSARYVGAMAARGEYILCVDADDYLDADCVQEIDRVLSQYTVDIVLYDYYEVYGNDIFEIHQQLEPGFYDREKIELKIFPELIRNQSGGYIHPALWCKMIRRELFIEAQSRIDPQIRMGEDAACSITCLYNSTSIFFIQKPLYYYRKNIQSATNSRKPLSWESAQCLSIFMTEEFSGKSIDFEKQVARFICHHFFIVSLSQFRRNDAYRIIRNEIVEKMDEPVFSSTIKGASFSMFSKDKLAEICLKRKMIFFIFVYGRLANMRKSVEFLDSQLFHR